MKCFIKTLAGLGDIIYSHKIGYVYHEKGYDVIWPIAPIYLDLMNKYVDSPFKYCTIQEAEEMLPESHKGLFKDDFCGKEFIHEDDFAFLPLHTADASAPYMRHRIMFCKYAAIAQASETIDPSDWHKYFNVKRDREREESLYSELGLDEDSKYALVNRNFGTQGASRRCPFPLNTSLPIIEFGFIENFSIFDWFKVIENATEIHSVDTVLHYFIDIENLLTLKANKMELYSRYFPASDFNKAVNDVLIRKDLWNLNR
tara:strand:+ start:27052 stop:27825 length:774 start_codon:yes stop_codon:yes gene_type:complete